MKFLLNENRIQGLIERWIKDHYKEVVGVSFTKKRVILGSTEGHPTITQTVINIIVDPYEIKEGNVHKTNNSWTRKYKQEITETINSLFNLKMEQYGSEWDCKVYHISLVSDY
jgi:hypothetical protein